MIHNNRRLAAPDALVELAFNFDALLVVRGAEPGTPLEGVLDALRALR